MLFRVPREKDVLRVRGPYLSEYSDTRGRGERFGDGSTVGSFGIGPGSNGRRLSLHVAPPFVSRGVCVVG